MKLLDGSKMAAALRATARARAGAFAQRHGRKPLLAICLAGASPPSKVYVAAKMRAAEEAEVATRLLSFDATITTAALIATIAALNANSEVDGIIVQLPLPNRMAQLAVLSAIDPAKDVDGLHPRNLGLLAAGARAPYAPCAAEAIVRLAALAVPDLAGQRVVVIGASALVGLPTALLMTQAHATTTLAHAATVDLARLARQADVLVAAAGAPELVRADWVKPGATLIDAGFSRQETADGKARLVGDIAEEARAKAGACTPVPGGVGPVTIACLLTNVIRAAEALVPRC